MVASPAGANEYVPELVAALQPVPRVAGAFSIVMGTLVLIGWLFGIPILTSVLPHLATMKANTALAFVVVGAALWALDGAEPDAGARRFADICAIVLLLIGACTLAQYAFGVNLGIDQFIVADHATLPGNFPGRMAPSTAITFILLGASLLLARARTIVASQVCSISVVLIAVLALMLYLYDVTTLYHTFPYTTIALHTAATLVVLGFGLLLARPQQGLVRVLVSAGSGGFMARRILPTALALPILLGWVRLQGERIGWYNTDLGVALFAASTMVLLSSVIWWNATLLERGEFARHEANAKVRYQAGLLNHVSDAIIATDMGFHITSWNRAAETIYGWTSEEAIGKLTGALLQNEYENGDDADSVRQHFAQQGFWQGEVIQRHKDGSPIDILASVVLLTDADDRPVGAVSVNRDISLRKRAERKQERLEAQLLQASKMESIGQLAGGVAHDFNNLLTAITSYNEFARESLPTDSPVQSDLEEIKRAAQRAAALTRQLLAFARKQVIAPQVVNLNEIVVNTHALLRRLIGEHIEIAIATAPELDPVRVDPSQIEQVIVNLAVNARDAMPDGGRLALETRTALVDEHYAQQHLDLVPGRYVVLAISDTGLGMSEAVQRRAFEPFFTTKEPGKGTGLGLATCYGIIKQHGGDIWLYSEEGHGTTFLIYLPSVAEPAAPLGVLSDTAPLPRGDETVLLVEDEPAVRALAVRVLRAQGYTVLEATNGEEGIAVAAAQQQIDLLVTDVVMPRMGGRLLAEQLGATRPGLKVLFVSGYPAGAIEHHGWLTDTTLLLQKPFSPAVLARKVREAIDT